jgi:hypothetical protein
VPNEVIASLLEASVQDAVEALRLADVALGGIWNALLGQAVEASIPVSEPLFPSRTRCHTDSPVLA